MRTLSLSLGVLALSLSLGACKARQGSQALEDATPAPNAQEAEAFVAKLDAGCASASSCHHNVQRKLQFSELKKFADQTASYHRVLEEKNCYAATLSQAAAQDCWGALQGAGGLNPSGQTGGIFQGAIRGGIVKKIRDAAGLPETASDEMYEMPPSPPPAARDIAADLASFRALAAWLTAETSRNYAGINMVRPRPTGGGGGGDASACDAVSPNIQALYRPNFRLQGVKMYGCTNDAQGWPTNPAACFSNLQSSPYTDASVQGNSVKILRKLVGRPGSSFWTRSSPDGRFISAGNGRIEDLATPDRSIKVTSGSIDPFYYPDNKFYTYPQMICPMGPLYNPATVQVGLGDTASQCKQASVSVYGSAGQQDDGTMLVGQAYSNNNPGSLSQTRDSEIEASAQQEFKIRVFSQLEILADSEKIFYMPYETDFQTAPSGKIIVGRNTNGTQTYKVRMMKPDGQTLNPTDDTSTAKICMKGEKANISFDNRFVAFHHYSDGAPQDAGTTPGASNIFVYDLKAKRGVRVTNMTGGAKAFFPHFRADGWLYFLIKEPGGVESVAASNIAFALAQ